MKDIHVLFSGAMVRAILDGRKTVTRRVIKPQPPEGWGGTSARAALATHCPYGVAGDRLLVGEPHWRWGYWTWPGGNTTTGKRKERFFATDGFPVRFEDDPPRPTSCPRIRLPGLCGYYKRSPMFLPFKHRRLILIREGDPRVERVQEITPDEIVAEGAWNPAHSVDADGSQMYEAFADLWDSINDKPNPSKRNPYTGKPEICRVAYPWEDVQETHTTQRKASPDAGITVYIVGNPWVWRAGFQRQGEVAHAE